MNVEGRERDDAHGKWGIPYGIFNIEYLQDNVAFFRL
jgi:hypothetical protein